VGDVDNVENAERQRYDGRDRRVEAADQDAGDDGVDQKIE
jgi:YD repeat-containing protein